MTINVAYCTRISEFSVGDKVPSPYSGQDMVNAVGNFVWGGHPWRFLEGREALLDLRGSITAAAATSTTVTLTSTGSFANYTFVEGDKLEITGGTGVTAGTYDVASKTDSNIVVLKTSPGSSGTAIAFTMDLPTIALPTDFGENLAGDNIHAKDNLVSILRLVGITDILQRRSSPTLASSSWTFYGAFTHNEASPPEPLIEIYPAPSGNSAEHFRMAYRKRWTDLTTDSATVPIKDWMIPLFTQCCIYWLRGLVEEDQMSLYERMDKLMASSLWVNAVKQDNRLTRSHGILRGGAVNGTPGRINHQLRSEVSAPV